MPYLHLPFQAGSDRILKAMNRKHTRADYAALVHKMRARGPTSRFPPISLSASPAKRRRISRRPWRSCARSDLRAAFSFKYSARPGTPAADLEGQVADARARERLLALQA